MMKTILTTCLVAGLLALRGHEGVAPVVTKASHRQNRGVQTLVINGSHFGAHANHNPRGPGSFLNVAWQDFESDQINGGNLQLENTAPYQWSIRHGNGRSNSRSYVRKVYIDNRLGELNLVQQNTTGTWFVSFWFRTSGVA